MAGGLARRGAACCRPRQSLQQRHDVHAKRQAVPSRPRQLVHTRVRLTMHTRANTQEVWLPWPDANAVSEQYWKMLQPDDEETSGRHHEMCSVRPAGDPSLQMRVTRHGKGGCARRKRVRSRRQDTFPGRLRPRVAGRTFVELSGLPGRLPFLCSRHCALRTRRPCRS